jgi:trehalose 6-phosphate phosphatase
VLALPRAGTGSPDKVMANVIQSLVADLNRLAILLDVDGSVLDLAPTPQAVRVPPALLKTLARLAPRIDGALAFVSGRTIEDLDRLFAPLQLPAIGCHGAELRLLGRAPRYPSGSSPLDSTIRRKLASIAAVAPGILAEDKGYSLALHYRLAPDQEAVVRDAAAAVCADQPTGSLELLPGKLMVEIKPVGFNKGSAVRELMKYHPFAGRRPVFIGDDVTDQTVFGVMPDFGGLSISVGNMPEVDYQFDRPESVRDWLDELSYYSKTP